MIFCMSYDVMVSKIKAKMDALGYKQSELAKKSGLSTSQVSRILSLESTPSQDAIASIERALKFLPGTLFRAAGILPPEPGKDPWVEAQKAVIAQLTGPRRNLAERLLQGLLDEENAQEYPTDTRPANATRNP